MSCIDTSVRIVTKSSKVGPLLLFFICLGVPVKKVERRQRTLLSFSKLKAKVLYKPEKGGGDGEHEEGDEEVLVDPGPRRLKGPEQRGSSCTFSKFNTAKRLIRVSSCKCPLLNLSPLCVASTYLDYNGLKGGRGVEANSSDRKKLSFFTCSWRDLSLTYCINLIYKLETIVSSL
jgi:hypothetical protein